MLIVFAGLPGTGKTTIAEELARELGAVYLRIDAIEQTLRDSGAYNSLTNDAGYCVAYVIAEENLQLAASSSQTPRIPSSSPAIPGSELRRAPTSALLRSS